MIVWVKPYGCCFWLWNKSLTDVGLLSEMWLYAYEATRKGWTGQPGHFVRTNLQFSELHRRQITFYDENRNFLRADNKIEFERKSRQKEEIAFAYNLEDTTFDLLERSDDYEDGVHMIAPDGFYSS